jgi:hypothetical protein
VSGTFLGAAICMHGLIDVAVSPIDEMYKCRPVRLAVRTSASHVENRGSIPLRGANSTNYLLKSVRVATRQDRVSHFRSGSVRRLAGTRVHRMDIGFSGYSRFTSSGIAPVAMLFCCAAFVYLSASFSVRHPNIAISWCGVAPFSAAIAAPALRSPCAVQ